MATYRVTGPDGSSYRISAPDDASPEQVQQVVAQHIDALPEDHQREVAREAMQHAQDILHGRAPNPYQEAPGVLARVGRGATDIYRGAEELGLQAFDKDLAAGIRGKDQDEEQLYERGRGPNAGVDWWRGVGEAAAASPAMLIPGVGGGLLRVATAGAAQGGLMGAMESARKGDSILGGAVTGAVVGVPLSLAAHGAVGALGKMANSITQYVRSQLPAAGLHDVLNAIHDTMKAQGIDFDRLSDSVKAGIEKEVQRALDGGRTVDPNAAANKAAFGQLGIKPTLGQVTQDPVQFSKEAFLRNTSEPLANQYTGALQGLQQGVRGLQERLPEALNNPEAGARVMRPLQDVATQTQRQVDAAYEAFRAGAPESFAVDGQNIAKRFFQESERDPGLRNLPSSLVGALNSLSSGSVGRMTLSDADAITREINRQLSGATPAQRFSLNTLKTMINDEVDAAAGLPRDNAAKTALADMQSSGDVVQRLFAARRLAAQRFGLLDKVPAMRAAADESTAPDDFIRKYITGPTAKVEDVGNLKRMLGTVDPEAWQQVRAQVLANLNNAATKGSEGKFLQSAFNQELNSLAKAGKLEMLFDPDEVSQLRTIGHVGRLVVEGPAGQSRTGFGGAAHAQSFLLDLISRLDPHVGTAARLLSRTVGHAVKDELQAREALRPGISVASPQDGGGLLARAPGALTTAAIAPAVHETVGSADAR